jgi:chemotaxis protein CheD
VTATANEVMVRMGELATSAVAGEALVSIGLGSCIGLALLDVRRPIVGLAHIMLPARTGDTGPPAKSADRGVPGLIGALRSMGAVRLEAVLVGGAQMFSFGGDGPAANIGPRNEAAVREQLERAAIPIRAAATGGRRGRTIRVHVDGARVTVREVAGIEHELYGRTA